MALWIGGAEWVVLGIRSAWLDGRRWTVLPVINFERLSMVILGGEPFQHPAGEWDFMHQLLGQHLRAMMYASAYEV